LNKKQAEKITKRLLEEWGEDRNVYLVTISELKILINGGAEIKFLNQTNSNDNNLKHTVLFNGKMFTAFSEEKINT
jgi:hypothetical protein